MKTRNSGFGRCAGFARFFDIVNGFLIDAVAVLCAGFPAFDIITNQLN